MSLDASNLYLPPMPGSASFWTPGKIAIAIAVTVLIIGLIVGLVMYFKTPGGTTVPMSITTVATPTADAKKKAVEGFYDDDEVPGEFF